MGGIFHNIDNKGNKDLILPTVLRVSMEEIEYWTNMTCFYDKNWEFESSLATVPLSFMHITSITEIISAQGSEKRVILYESPGDNKSLGFKAPRSHPSAANNLRVIMDNVVVQPKQYQMEVIIPDSLIGPFHKQGLARLEALTQYMGLTDAKGSGAVDADKYSFGVSIADALRYAQTAISAVETAANLADLVLGAFTGSSQMDTLNKNSVQAMASRGHVVVFKKWTGYDYSYGIITKIDISKKPSEDGVCRGSITFQETPILNISQKDVSVATSFSSAVQYAATQTARVINLAMALPFLKITGVMNEAGAPGSNNNENSFTEFQTDNLFSAGF